MGVIRTGTAVTNLEMPVGNPMTGYYGRKSNSTGIHDELKISSIVFDDGLCKILLVECDLLGLTSEFSMETAKLIEKKTGIPACNIVIACIHTHSGPASIHLQDCGEIDRDWLKRLGPDIADCAAKAVDGLKPAILEYRTAECDIGINRDDHDNRIISRDVQTGVLIVKDAASGEIDTIVVNYACHPVVLTEKNLLYSKDYPYYLEKYLKEKFGESVNVIFATGCDGDINPSDRGDFDAAERVGKRLADCIIDSSVVSISDSDFKDAGLGIESFCIDIPLDHDFDETSACKLREDFLAEAEKMTGAGKTVDAGINLAYARWADLIYKNAKLGMLEKSYKADVKLIRIGKLVVVTFPFEMFHEIGINIKKHFGYGNTMVIGYANGDYGYFPSSKLYPIAYYEAGSAHRFYGHPGPVAKGSEDIIYKVLFT